MHKLINILLEDESIMNLIQVWARNINMFFMNNNDIYILFQ